MKKSTLVVGMMLLYFGLSAQQDPQFTQWMFDKVSFNPAATGANDAHCVSLFYRDQWDGLEEDPKTSMFNYNGLVAPRVGIGIVFADDRLGQMRTTTVRLNGAYHLPTDIGILSGGISLSSNGMRLGQQWRPWQLGDPDIPTQESSSSSFDVGLGVMLRDNDWYAGISATHLNESELDLDVAKFNVIRHYYIMGGYDYALPNTDLKLRSNALIKTEANSMVFDLNVNVLWNNMIWGGLSFRPGDAVAPMAGFMYQLNDIRKPESVWTHKIMLGYSYDATLSELNNHSTGSHEIFLTYCFNIQQIIIKKLYSNPRFL